MMQPTAPTDSVIAHTRFKVSGMTCGNCARKVTSAIQSVGGMDFVDVDVDSQTATLRWSDSPGDPQAVLQAIKSAGYRAEILQNSGTEETPHNGWQIGLIIGACAASLMLIGEWILHWGAVTWFKWFSFALASAVQGIAGARFYRGAWRQLKVGSSNMDTLVALGSTTAYIYSTWALFAGWPGHLFFMEAAAIITLVSGGHWMESRVSARAATSLKALMTLTPRTARRRDSTGSEQEVAVSELRSGDQVLLRPGDAVPTDGRIQEGDSSVDESMLTGESLPVDKSNGQELFAGTTVLDGKLTMQVTATGDSTALAQIIAAVRRAQSSSASIQRLGDRVSSVFVPIVLAVALSAGLWWGLAYDHARSTHEWISSLLWAMPVPSSAMAAGFIIAAGVLIIACPCAMGLATPAAIMAAANAAAKRGILIRDGVALEKAGTITAVVFDKTGTLTTGKPVVAAIARPTSSDAGASEDSTVKQLAAAVTRHSKHPFSRAIAQLDGGEVEVGEWRELRGAGVSAKVQWNGAERTLRLGSLRWLNKACPGDGTNSPFIQEWETQGASIVGLGLDRTLIGLFAIKDELKPGAAAVVSRLEQAGARVFMVTGDQTATAKSIGQQAGIQGDRIRAEVRPEEKAAFLADLQGAGERVAFVGDGINDAPALEQANLGVAVSRASDIAREAADIVLLNSDIEAVPESLELARATLRTIKQNLFWAFFYNAAGIPLAALGFLSPILCALAMGASDLVVIGNALRLKRYGGKRSD